VRSAVANAEQLDVLADVGAPGLDGHRVARIQQVIVDTGALDELEAHITALTEAAVCAIEDAPIVEAAKTELVALAEYVSWRNM
jgi:geranylgeranyl diphosphate synthase, type I